MTRSWLLFAVALVLLITPLRLIWSRPGAPVWAIFGIWSLLVLLGAWQSRLPKRR